MFKVDYSQTNGGLNSLIISGDEYEMNWVEGEKTFGVPYIQLQTQFNRFEDIAFEYVNHPSQKPEALLERIVFASSNENDYVLDLFAGSFSLGMVCKKLNRNYIGIEKSIEYSERGKIRLTNDILNE